MGNCFRLQIYGNCFNASGLFIDFQSKSIIALAKPQIHKLNYGEIRFNEPHISPQIDVELGSSNVALGSNGNRMKASSLSTYFAISLINYLWQQRDVHGTASWQLLKECRPFNLVVVVNVDGQARRNQLLSHRIPNILGAWHTTCPRFREESCPLSCWLMMGVGMIYGSRALRSNMRRTYWFSFYTFYRSQIFRWHRKNVNCRWLINDAQKLFIFLSPSWVTDVLKTGSSSGNWWNVWSGLTDFTGAPKIWFYLARKVWQRKGKLS